jgi:hypothetical protein
MTNKIIAWILGIGLVFMLVLTIMWILPGMVGYRGSMMGGYGMMGRGFGFGFSPLGWLGMGLMWILPVGILFLVVLGAVSLINNLTHPTNPNLPIPPAASGRVCQNCGKSAQADWSVCPHCGQKLS